MDGKRLKASKKVDASHFLHIRKRKYKKQYRELRKLYDDDSFKIESSYPFKEKSMGKYWRQRKKLFSKISESPIYMTHELWFSVTPEMIAKFVAKYVRACLPKATTVLDVFCGGGGNTIQFAKLFPKVYGVDFSLEHLYCTYQNAKTYNVEDRIWLKYASWTRMVEKGKVQKLGVDCIFGSPPWGGPDYLRADQYDLENSLLPIGVTELLRGFLSVSKNVIMFLPKNSNLKQLAMATRTVQGIHAKCKVIHVKQNGFSKGLFCIWGEDLINYEQEEGGNIANTIDLSEEESDNGQNKSPTNDKVKARKIEVSYDIDG